MMRRPLRFTLFPTRRSSDLDTSYDAVYVGIKGMANASNGSKNPMDAMDEETKKFDAFAIPLDRKSTRLNSSHPSISYAVFCLKKKIDLMLLLSLDLVMVLLK